MDRIQHPAAAYPVEGKAHISTEASKRTRGIAGLIWPAVIGLLALTPSASHGESAQLPRQAAGGRLSSGANCPSQDFGEFLRSFAESVEIQRRFTQLPLIHTLRDLDPPPKLITTKIAVFEKIEPNFPEDNGSVFPSAATRSARDYSIVVKNGTSGYFSIEEARRSNVGAKARGASVFLYIENTDSGVYYRFKRERNCWFLYEIDDE